MSAHGEGAREATMPTGPATARRVLLTARLPAPRRPRCGEQLELVSADDLRGLLR